MRAALLTGTLMLVFAIPAVAQAPSWQGHQSYQNNVADEDDQDDYGPPGRMWRDDGQQGWGRWHDGQGSWGSMGRRFRPELMREMMRMRGLMGGPFYRVKHGDDEIDVHCSPREQIDDCIKGATDLMKALQQPGSSSTPSAGQKQ